MKLSTFLSGVIFFCSILFEQHSEQIAVAAGVGVVIAIPVFIYYVSHKEDKEQESFSLTIE